MILILVDRQVWILDVLVMSAVRFGANITLLFTTHELIMALQPTNIGSGGLVYWCKRGWGLA